MRNLLALSFVTLFLAACAQYSYVNTHANPSLIEQTRHGDEQWRESIRAGGLFRGLD
jgi:hypothetical protein